MQIPFLKMCYASKADSYKTNKWWLCVEKKSVLMVIYYYHDYQKLYAIKYFCINLLIKY